MSSFAGFSPVEIPKLSNSSLILGQSTLLSCGLGRMCIWMGLGLIFAIVGMLSDVATGLGVRCMLMYAMQLDRKMSGAVAHRELI